MTSIRTLLTVAGIIVLAVTFVTLQTPERTASVAQRPCPRPVHPDFTPLHDILAKPRIENPAKFEQNLADVEGYNTRDPSHCSKAERGGRGIKANPGAFPVCVHRAGDIVSDFWVRNGTWTECLVMPWLAYVGYAHSSHYTENGQPLVADVGGNIGSCSHYLLHAGMCPVTVEPTITNSRILHTTWAVNGWDCGTLVKAAVGEKPGNVKIKLIGSNLGGSFIGDSGKKSYAGAVDGEETVPVVRLDSVVRHHLHFMKVDIQGYEVYALRSLVGLLKRHGLVDVMHIEFSARFITNSGVKPEEFWDLLFGWGYRVVTEEGQEVAPSQVPGIVADQMGSSYKEMNVFAVAPNVFGRAGMDSPAFWHRFRAAVQGSTWPSTPAEWVAAAKQLSNP